MRITKYIGRGLLLAMVSIAISGHYFKADALTLPSTFSLPGLSLSPKLSSSGLTDTYNHPLSIQLDASYTLPITKTNNVLTITNTPISLVQALPASAEAVEKKSPIIEQVYAAEVTADVVTATPTPSPTDTPTPIPASVDQNANAGGLNADVLFNLVNTHRQAINLPPFQKNDQVCSLATARAPEIANEIATGHMHAGMYGRNLPYWNTENIIAINSESAAFNWWMSDYIHKKAIESDNTYSCVACSGNACAEEFTSFQAK